MSTLFFSFFRDRKSLSINNLGAARSGLAGKYYQAVKGQIEALGDSQMTQIETAAGWFAEAMNAGRLVYVFGTGHSHMLAEALF